MQVYRILPLALAALLAAPWGLAQDAVKSNPKRYPSSAETHRRTLDRSIYGYFYMTGHDRDMYYKRLRESTNPQDRSQFLAEHYERMQARAKVYGDTLPAPPHLATR